MAEIGIRYIEDREFKRTVETETDLTAIKHGFGYQLLEYAILIEELIKKYPDEPYYQTYFSFYMTTNEIMATMQELEIEMNTQT